MSKTMIIKPHTPKSVRISLTQLESGEKHFVAHIEEFRGGEEFIQLIHVLRTSIEGDKVMMFINSPGGNAHACRALINAMKATKAEVTTAIGFYGASCGAYTWAHGHILLMPKFGRVMFHGTSHGDYDKTGKVIERAESIVNTTQMWLDVIVEKGILTEEDREAIIENKRDVWFTANQMKERGVLND